MVPKPIRPPISVPARIRKVRAIEGQQAVQALAAAQTQYLTSVTEYNQAQFQLLRAIGQPLGTTGAGSTP
jgi:hypothetical protein